MMNIETLLQAAQILENQQSVPPKKRLSRSESQFLDPTEETRASPSLHSVEQLFSLLTFFLFD